MRSRLRGFLLTLAGLAIIILVALSIISIVYHAYTPPPLPNPNGYAGIVKAAQTIRDDPPDFSKPDEQQLQAFVRSNFAALQLIRSNLSKPVQVPVAYSPNYDSPHLAELAAVKRAALASAAEAHLAQLQHRPADAVKCDLDIIRLGVKCPHGGLLIDALVGDAMESIGTSELQKLTGTLDGNTSKKAAREIEDIESQKQTWKQVLQQEHYWSAKAFPGFPNFVGRLVSFNSIRKAEAKGERRYKITTKNTRTLMINLATRAYTLENGHPPAKISDLVPAYLKAVPLDAMTGASMTNLP